MSEQATPPVPIPQRPTFRGSPPAADLLPALGPLQELPGTWQGAGFNLISRPDKQGGQPFFLELNATQEVLDFTTVGPIPNRGSVQGDIEFFGVHYLQQVSDAVAGGLLHVEPGIWLSVPPTTAPQVPSSVVRLAVVPHGDSLLAQGSSVTAPAPQIDPVSPTPLDHANGQPLTAASYLAPFTSTALPSGIPAGAIANPNLVLTEAIKSQTIASTVVLQTDTTSPAGIMNIPFVLANANAISMRATFWIETVEHPEGAGQFMQLQYTQTVILNFDGIDWPHISVATLVKH